MPSFPLVRENKILVDNSNSLSTALLTMISFFALAIAWFFRRRFLNEKQVEAQLQHSRDNLEFALQSGRMGTWDLDLVTNALTCSKEMLELWGVSEDEYGHQRAALQNRVHPEDLPKMNASINEAIAKDGLYELEYRILPKPGQMKWVLSRGRCTFATGSHKAVRLSGVVFDITQRKEHEEALAEAVRIRDQFLTIAGHELKTPLTSMQLQIQVRQRDLKRNYESAFTPEKIAANLQEQLENVRRMTRLVDDMLDVSQISEGRLRLAPESFDIVQLVRDVLGRFREGAEIGIELQSEGQAPIVGHWDRFRVEQVLLNLLTNAVKYGDNKPVEVLVAQVGEFAHIHVRDQGVGIPATDQARIFQRYERAISENEVCGLGLGLYIANTIAQLHGGEIRLKSEPGQGSEFTVVLPIQKGLQ